MKKAIVGSLCYLMASLSLAQEVVQVPAQCITYKALDEVLAEFDELPFVRGLSYRETQAGQAQNPLVMFVNAKTGSWTLIERDGDKYCILAVGTTLEPVPSSIVDDIVKKRERSRS